MIILIFLVIHTSSDCQIQSALTINIRYDNPNDGKNQWDKRKLELVTLIDHYHPEIFGVQEALLHQCQYIDKHLSNYTMIGVGRDDGINKGEFSSIFYDSTKYKVVMQSTFWLSDSPEKISVGWDASMERICTYGLFENINNKKKVWIFNTHYDHIGVSARENSSELIVDKIKSLNKSNYPVILMGDFNSEPGTVAINTIENFLTDGAQSTSDGIYGPIGTYNGFDSCAILDRRIDYIFTSGLKVIDYINIDDRMKNGNCISDHLPVLIRFK